MIVDFNTYVGTWWPGHELADGRPEAVRESLAEVGIEAAFVSLMEAPWFRDQQVGNERLARLVEKDREFFLPVACLDPTATFWPEDLERSVAGLGMVGVRLYPTYHHYYLDDEPVIALARKVGRRGLPLFVTLMMEEDRFAHPAVREIPLRRKQAVTATTPPAPGAMVVDGSLKENPIPPLAALLRAAPETTVVVTMAAVEEAFSILRDRSLSAGRVYFDVSRMDKPTVGLDRLVGAVGAEHLVLGTHAPFQYPTGAVMNLAYRSFGDEVGQRILARNYQASSVLNAVIPDRQQRHKA
ncbi:MAG: amidohydrolase family protein [Anaerolineae bacterium]|nr:amidohydrolase family protein [Anaerolineae bacterium]